MDRRTTGTRDCLVLVVEDDDDTRDSLEDLLGHAGYGVLAAANGAAALSLLRAAPQARNPPCDLVILDLMMPVMNGWDFHARLKANPRLAHVPVLLLSAYVHNETHTGPKDVEVALQKPIRIEEFLGWVRRLARRLNR